jgi:hypothetical protein
MKVLIIDSHKSSNNKPQASLHWQNAKILADRFGADLIWSYPGVNDQIKSGYDVILFCHSSAYSFVSDEWLEQSPNARLFFVANDYVLGESMLLWSYVRDADKKYTVIANHDMEYSLKANKKWIKDWKIVNLNSLICATAPAQIEPSGFLHDFCGDTRKKACVYYGAVRKDRETSFKKYLNSCVVSTHQKNVDYFRSIGVTTKFIPRLDLSSNELSNYYASLYIEDDTTHTDYSCLANRFYEALNSNVAMLFDAACENTIKLSGYGKYIDKSMMISSETDIISRLDGLHDFSWSSDILDFARQEQEQCLVDIEQIIMET